MSICPKCAATTAPDARFCTECGTPIASSVAQADSETYTPCGEDAHAALAAANLCKLRGEWQAAIDRCIYVLALDQDNAAAHSLLGDIYRDQGHMSEAMHWYKMALDLNPESAYDQGKLDQILALRQARRPGRSVRTSEVVGTAKRVIAEAVLAIGVLLFITTIWPILSHPKLDSGQAGKPDEHPQTVRLPLTVPDDSAEPQPTIGKPVGTSMSSEEDALLQSLNAAPSLILHRVYVKGVAMDPRNRSAVVTCACEPGKESAGQALARVGLIVLREACFKKNSLDHFTVRVTYGAAQGGPADVQFLADAERSAILSINPEVADYDQLVRVIRNPWWAPGIK
jgi:hypothetical protein